MVTCKNLGSESVGEHALVCRGGYVHCAPKPVRSIVHSYTKKTFFAKKFKEYLPLAQKIWSRQKVGNFCFCNNNYTLHKSSCLTAWPGARCTAHPFQKPVFIESYLDNLSNLPSNRSRCVLKQFLAECRWVGTVIRASGSGPSIV